MKHALAYDVNGDPFDVPEAADAWRVRRASSSRGGRPHNVYDPETGRPLQIPLTATIDHLRQLGCKPGRYRLDAVNAEGQTIVGAVAMTEIPDERDDEEIEEASNGEVHQVPGRVLESIEHMVNTVCRTMEAMTSSFGPLQPARPTPIKPQVIVEQQPPPAKTDDMPAWAQQLLNLAMQLAPAVIQAISSRGGAHPSSSAEASASVGATS